jgi:hypothetical protein
MAYLGDLNILKTLINDPTVFEGVFSTMLNDIMTNRILETIDYDCVIPEGNRFVVCKPTRSGGLSSQSEKALSDLLFLKNEFHRYEDDYYIFKRGLAYIYVDKNDIVKVTNNKK